MNRSTPLRRRVLLTGLLTPVLAPISHARAQDSITAPQSSRAPFGLTWGMTTNDLHNLGREIRLSAVGSAGDQIMYRSWNLPRVPPDTHSVDFYFGKRNALHSVYAQGKPGPTDAVMSRYGELSLRLAEIYGVGSETVTARKWFGRNDPDSVLRQTVFRTDELSVAIYLLSGFGENVYWSINYRNRTRFTEFEADHRKRDSDAL